MGGAVREARPVVALGLIGTERLGHRIYRAAAETAAGAGMARAKARAQHVSARLQEELLVAPHLFDIGQYGPIARN